MYLSHVSITIPPGGERAARDFYVKLLGLREIPAGSVLRAGICLDAGGLELHLTVDDHPTPSNKEAHLGLGCGDLEGLKARLLAAGVPIENPSTPARKFFARDPFGNNLEIHVPGNFENSAGQSPALIDSICDRPPG